MLSKLKNLSSIKIIEKSAQRTINGGFSEDKQEGGALTCFVFVPGDPCPTGFRQDGTRCCRTDVPYIPGDL